MAQLLARIFAWVVIRLRNAGIWSAAIAGIAQAFEWILERIRESSSYASSLLDEVERWAAQYLILDRVGLELDHVNPFSNASFAHALGKKFHIELLENDPFSEASVAHALSAKLGLAVTFTNLRDPKQVLADFQAPIVVQINQQLGTSFTHLYPVNDFKEQFNAQLNLQVEKHFSGQLNCLSTATTNMLKTRVGQEIGGRAFPRSLKETEKAIKDRRASKEHYLAMVGAGYKKAWVKIR